MPVFKHHRTVSGTNRIRAVMREANKADFSHIEDQPAAIKRIRGIATEAIKNAVRETGILG